MAELTRFGVSIQTRLLEQVDQLVQADEEAGIVGQSHEPSEQLEVVVDARVRHDGPHAERLARLVRFYERNGFEVDPQQEASNAVTMTRYAEGPKAPARPDLERGTQEDRLPGDRPAQTGSK